MPDIINCTANLSLFTNDLDDITGDIGDVAVVGWLRFVPQISDGVAALGDTAAYILRGGLADDRAGGFKGYIDTDGVLKDKPAGTPGARIWANDPVLNIERLIYKVIPHGLTDLIGRPMSLNAFTFEAPSTDTEIDLKSVMPVPGLATSGVVRRQGYAEDIIDGGILGRDIVRANDETDFWGLFGSVPPENLPSYIDDVFEFANFATFPSTGVSGRIYIALDTGDSYRWSGSIYVRISDRVNAAGITDATTYTKNLLTTVDDASEARTYMQVPSYFRRARTVADPTGTDDTAAVQAVLAEGAGEVVFRKGGTWIIDANPTTGMLKPLSNTRVIIEEGATVQVKTNALDLYYLFQVDGVSNVTIEGMGTLLGDALVHTGSTGQYGHLINITNSSDVRVGGPLRLTHAWGDGIYIGGGSGTACADILVDGVIIEDCRREGISPFWVDGCTIRDCRIVDIASTAYVPGGPGSGIDVEPNDGQYVNNLTIENNYIAGTAGNGMYISTLPAGGVAPYTTNVIIRDNHITGCGVVAGGALTASGPSGFTNGIYVRDIDDPIIIDNVIFNTGFTGDTGFVSTGIKSNLCDRPVIKDNTVSGSTGAGILVTGGTQPEIVGNTVRNNAQRGISTGVAAAVIRGNQVFDNNQAAGSSEHHASISGDGCAVVGNVFRGSNGNSWVRISSGTDSLVANNVGIGTAPTNKLSDAGTTTRKSLNVRVATGVYESWDVTGATPMGVIELGHATDTTVSRSAAGQISVEGVAIPTISSTNVITNKDLTSPTNTFPELVAAPTHAATSKATPIDADEIPLADSAASFGPKKLTWANLKATLGVWLDSLTATWANKTLTAPVLTGTSTVPQSGIIASHNQADQTTNYERARHYWSSNAYTIETDAGGSGTLRDMQMVAANNQSIRVFGATQASTVGTVRLRANLSAASGCIAGVNGTLSAASGVQYGLSISPTINQTVTAGYVAVLVNVTETGTGSGAKLLADFQVGGTSKVKIDDTGVITTLGSIELGHASDTTVSRSAAGKIAVEGIDVVLTGGALGTPSSGTLTNCTGLPVAGITPSTATALGVGSLELGHASDTTISRYTSGVIAVEGALISTQTVTSLTTTATLSAVAGREFVYLLGTGAVPTLPTAVGSLSSYVLKNVSAGTINIATTSSQTIDGAAAPYVLAAKDSITIVSDQTNWWII